MKKIYIFTLALAFVFGITACGSSADKNTGSTTENNSIVDAENNGAEKTKPQTITIQALNANGEKADVEVPYDPGRIAILDMAALDIVDALGVGERVVGSSQVSIEYLTDYNPDDSDGAILNLGTVKTADLEKVAACEPDIIFIGGRLADVYTDLEAIAPVVYLAVDYEKGVVESTRANAQTIASIFGKKSEVDDLIKELDVYKNGRIVYFIDHANVWYTSTGGVQALDTFTSYCSLSA